LTPPGSESSTNGGEAWPLFSAYLPTSNGNISSEAHDSVPLQVAQSDCPSLQPSWELSTIDKELLVKSYYMHFHPSHSLLVPRSYFAQLQYPDYLQWVIYFIAQQYVAQYSGNLDIQRAVEIMLAPDKDETTVSRVQALVLYSIILHSLHCPHEALACIRRAGQLANAMGLHRPDFASLNAVTHFVQEESIRRTWWELHVVETYLAALHRRPSLLSKFDSSYPLLPSSEESYNAGTCAPDPPSITMFENRAFARQSLERRYSTYCYRIEAIRIVRRVLGVYESEDADPGNPDAYQAVDNAIASWKYYLPATGTHVPDEFGEMDPLLFQAHFFVHTASILLHFPRSDLPPTVPSAAEIACLKGHTQSLSRCSQNTMKAIAASKEISNLAATLSSTDSCSPFFICALILACIVQLAASTIHRKASDGSFLPQYRDRVILLLGVLTEMGRRWTVARNALEPLRLVADTIFGASQPQAATVSGHSQGQGGFPSVKDVQAGIPWFDLFSVDELMSDFMSAEPEAGFSEPDMS
jgi:hypothetical protein